MKNKMKKYPFVRIAFFLLCLIGIAIIMAFVLFYYFFSIPEPEGLSLASWPNRFTDNFSMWMEYEDGEIHVRETGLKRLEEYGLWVQVIVELVMVAIAAICIVIAPVFSGEYQAGTDAVILSAKYGKTKLVTAKIVASLLFGLLAFTLHMMIAFGLPLMGFGVDGWNLLLQSGNTVIPYPFTFMEATFINLGVIYLVLIAMIALTLLLSAKMKSPYLVLTVIVPVLFVPIFLTPNGPTGAYNLTLFLLPYKATVPRFADYITYQFGGLVMDAFTARTVLYAVLTVIMLPLAKLGFKKHQVSA